jgi:hypothetical protein
VVIDGDLNRCSRNEVRAHRHFVQAKTRRLLSPEMSWGPSFCIEDALWTWLSARLWRIMGTPNRIRTNPASE